MDSFHAERINRPRLRAKEFTGGEATERSVGTLRQSGLHGLRLPLSTCNCNYLAGRKILDRSEQGELPPLQSSDDIRLVKVLPTLREGFSQCLISSHSINESFMTLSYTWGPSSNDHIVWLNGVMFNVRCHLWNFLLMASHNYPNVFIWIDAICIDQFNTTERSEQVRRMGNIYSLQQDLELFGRAWVRYE